MISDEKLVQKQTVDRYIYEFNYYTIPCRVSIVFVGGGYSGYGIKEPVALTNEMRHDIDDWVRSKVKEIEKNYGT